MNKYKVKKNSSKKNVLSPSNPFSHIVAIAMIGEFFWKESKRKE